MFFTKKKKGAGPIVEVVPMPDRSLPERPGVDHKPELLAELADRYAYWKSKGTAQGDEFAAGYERLMCVFTQPEEKQADKK